MTGQTSRHPAQFLLYIDATVVQASSMKWRTQGLCPACGQRLPVAALAYHNVGFGYEGHEKCRKQGEVFTHRKAPAEPFNRLYQLPCVKRFLGGGVNLTHLITRFNIEHKILRFGDREIKCVTFEEILRHSADSIAKPVWNGTGPFVATTRNRTFRRLDDVERMCFLDSARFRKIWEHQEKEKSWVKQKSKPRH